MITVIILKGFPYFLSSTALSVGTVSLVLYGSLLMFDSSTELQAHEVKKVTTAHYHVFRA